MVEIYMQQVMASNAARFRAELYVLGAKTGRETHNLSNLAIVREVPCNIIEAFV
jgi:hypothetical protein